MDTGCYSYACTRADEWMILLPFAQKSLDFDIYFVSIITNGQYHDENKVTYFALVSPALIVTDSVDAMCLWAMVGIHATSNHDGRLDLLYTIILSFVVKLKLIFWRGGGAQGSSWPG